MSAEEARDFGIVDEVVKNQAPLPEDKGGHAT
jgi:ATP-dependent protease ClpP protease subunit